MTQTLGTQESTTTAMEPGHNSVLILMVRLLVIKVEEVCHFRLTAIDWPSAHILISGVAQRLGTQESTNTATQPGYNSVLILMVRLLMIEVDGVCRFRLTAIDWPSAPFIMTGMAPTLGTRESTNTAMQPGYKSVLILLVRLLMIKVDTVCRCRLTAIDWPSVPLIMTGVTQTLGTPESTNTAMQPGYNSVLILMVSILVIKVDTVCRFRLTAIDWPSAPFTMASPLGTRGSTNTAMEPGPNSVLILMVRLLVIEVAIVCRFRLTAIDWPSAPISMAGVAQRLGTQECTKSVCSLSLCPRPWPFLGYSFNSYFRDFQDFPRIFDRVLSYCFWLHLFPFHHLWACKRACQWAIQGHYPTQCCHLEGNEHAVHALVHAVRIVGVHCRCV